MNTFEKLYNHFEARSNYDDEFVSMLLKFISENNVQVCWENFGDGKNTENTHAIILKNLKPDEDGLCEHCVLAISEGEFHFLQRKVRKHKIESL